MKKALFYHIPRTGGLMLATKVWNYIGRENTYVDKGQRQDGFASDDREDAPGHWKEYDGPFVSSHEPVSLLERHVEGRVRFTILRDPVERVISLLRHHQSKRVAMGLSVVDYVLADSQSDAIRVGYRDRMVRQLGGNFYKDDLPIGEQLERAKEVLAGLDWIGFTDSLDDTLPDFFENVLEIPWTGPERINQSKPLAEDLTPHAQDTLRRLTQFDREIYDFAQTL